MARNEWRGDSQPVAQVRRYTLTGTPDAGDTVSLVVNLKEATYTLVTGDTLATAMAGLAAAWVAAVFPEAREANASYTTGDAFLDLTASTAGKPFTVTAAATGVTLTATDVTASKGPSHVDDADNWTDGIPTADDNVIIAGGASLLYGLGTLAGTTCDLRASFENAIGLPKWNTAGYYEYRTRELTLNIATVYVGRGEGNGSSELYLKGVASAVWEVHKTGNRTNESIPALDIGATGNITTIKVSGPSDVGFLVQDESTARTVTNVALAGDEARLTWGRLATGTNFDMDSGTADVYGVFTNPTIGRGQYNQHEGGFTTMLAYAGIVRLSHTGTATTVTGKGRGDGSIEPVFDCEQNSAPRTFTNSAFSGGACMWDANKSVTLDAGGTHTADQTFFANSRLGPAVTWNRT